MKKYETVIFDLDGTLLYTLEDLTKATNYALRRMNMPERTLDDVRRFVGNGVARLIELAVPEGTAPEVFEQTLAIFREYYDIHCNDNTKAYDGVIDLLRELKADGYALAIGNLSRLLAARTGCGGYLYAFRGIGRARRGLQKIHGASVRPVYARD